MKEKEMEILNEDLIDKIVYDKVVHLDTLFFGRFTYVCISEFSNEVIFSNCIFKKEMLIHSCDFTKDLIFKNCIFHDKAQFGVMDIRGNLVFDNCKFLQNFEFIDSTIHGKSFFLKCKFTKGINLFSKDEDSFGNVAFEGGLNVFR